MSPTRQFEARDATYREPTTPNPSTRQCPVLKSLIPDILRTKECRPGSIFLVEGVNSRIGIRASAAAKHRAVRLLLGDGRLCIQALLCSAAHRLVDGGVICKGSYISLERFRIRMIRKNTTGPTTVFLVVEQIAVVRRHGPDINCHEPRRSASREAPSGEVIAADSVAAEPEETRHPLGGSALTAHEEVSMDSLEFTEIHGHEDEPEQTTSHQAPSARPSSTGDDDGKPCHRFDTSTSQVGSGKAVPVESNDDPAKPLKLATLRSIPILPYKQNWMVNVLAVVSHISDVEASHLPPYLQRTARLADPSTSKQVLLTVFLDPGAFTPSVGSVVLLVGVKNHRFDGGSLKKYASDRPKDGTPWWFEDPWCLEWCDVAGLKAWWATRREAVG